MVLMVVAGARVRHSDVPQPLDPIFCETTSSTSSTATVSYGLRNDVVVHRRRHQPPRRRPPPPADVQNTCRVQDVSTTRAVQAPSVPDASVSTAWQSSTLDYEQSPKVVTIVDGTGVPRPRPNVKFLLNRQTVQTYEQFMRDVAYALSKGTTPTVADGGPSVRLFTVRGREVAGMSDLYRDDDVFIGVGVGRNELSVSEVREIFRELYPRGDYADVLVRKWTRTRRRHVRREGRTPGRKDLPDSDVAQVPAAAIPPHDAEPEDVVENETSESKPVAETVARAEDVTTWENDDKRRPNESSRKLSQSPVRPARARRRSRGGSEPRPGRTTLPPIASTSSQQTRADADSDSADLVARSRPHHRGRRHVRLPPLHDSSAAADARRKPSKKVRQDDGVAASGATSPAADTASRRAVDKDLLRGPATNDNDPRQSGKSPSTPRRRPAVDNQTRDYSPAPKTDENCNIITDVSRSGDNTARSTDATTSESKDVIISRCVSMQHSTTITISV